MLRPSIFALAVLAICAASVTANRRNQQDVRVIIKKVDAATGTIIFPHNSKTGPKDITVKVSAATKIIVFADTGKKVLTGMDGLKAAIDNGQVKEGATVLMTFDADGNLSILTVGNFPTPRSKKK